MSYLQLPYFYGPTLCHIYRTIFAALISAAAITLSFSANADFETAQASLKKCGLTATTPGRIVSIGSLGLMLLDDGRHLRLAGVWLADGDIQKALSPFIGRMVIPFPAAKKADRTGSIAAHFVFPTDEIQNLHAERWFQARLLYDGVAFLYIYPDRKACADELRKFEKEAMAARKGIWSQVLREDIADTPDRQQSAIIVGEADNLAIESAEGRYGIVSGHVVSTGNSGRWRYLNFGDNFSSDFTVRLTARVEKRLIEQGLTIKGLKDRHIEVRGVIQSKDGPMIDVFDAAQIVIME